jgi:hypothetical protein
MEDGQNNKQKDHISYKNEIEAFSALLPVKIEVTRCEWGRK